MPDALPWIIIAGLIGGVAWELWERWMRDNQWRIQDDAPDWRPLDLTAWKRGKGFSDDN